MYETEHGSDRRATITSFDMALPPQPQKERLFFKNAPWNDIREVLTYKLRDFPLEATVQEQADNLTYSVQETVWELTLRAPQFAEEFMWRTSLRRAPRLNL